MIRSREQSQKEGRFRNLSTILSNLKPRSVILKAGIAGSLKSFDI
jgi:hypothetical protein